MNVTVVWPFTSAQHPSCTGGSKATLSISHKWQTQDTSQRKSSFPQFEGSGHYGQKLSQETTLVQDEVEFRRDVPSQHHIAPSPPRAPLC